MSAAIYLGTSAFTAAGWDTAFYPAGMKAADYLSYYATKFQAVEIDSTFYAAPAAATVTRWRDRTPEGFIIAAKVPQAITHEKCLLECDEEFAQFVETMSLLGDRLGPLLLQFPYFKGEIFQSGVQFLARLKAFFRKLPKGKKFAVEIRNKSWIKPQFLDLLREYNVAFVLQDQSWMPRAAELFEKYDPVTADFTYIRWLGDRKGIETLTKVWDKTIIDRSSEMQEWVKYCRQIQRRGVTIYAFANNHYAGHGPGTVALFKQLYGIVDTVSAPIPARQADLFAGQKEGSAEQVPAPNQSQKDAKSKSAPFTIRRVRHPKKRAFSAEGSASRPRVKRAGETPYVPQGKPALRKPKGRPPASFPPC